MRLPAGLTNVALAKLHELIDLPSVPHDDPQAAQLQEVKRKARRILRLWNAGGPYEAFSPTQDDGKSKKRRRRRDPSR